MVVHTNALLGKAECFCDCSIIFILSPPPPPLFSLWTLQLLSFFIICVCECMFVWRGETHRHCTGWLFSWFIIINHCNDSFIQLVVTCVSGNVCVAVSSLQLILGNKPLTYSPSSPLHGEKTGKHSRTPKSILLQSCTKSKTTNMFMIIF